MIQEGFYNVTVVARNGLEDPFEYPLYFEIVLKVKVIKIDDFQLITSKEQNKKFEVTFDSIGSDTCMVIDFDDGTVKSFGDRLYCKEWQPNVKYDPTFEKIESPQAINYIY